MARLSSKISSEWSQHTKQKSAVLSPGSSVLHRMSSASGVIHFYTYYSFLQELQRRLARKKAVWPLGLKHKVNCSVLRLRASLVAATGKGGGKLPYIAKDLIQSYIIIILS